MKALGANELRERYLKFFEGKEHLRLDSFPLVPKNDKSLLLINAGMAPLKPYFTGMEKPPKSRITTCQKCIRTGDIENVGKTSRHGTFFEMLGNFSFGDYFKEEIIPWAWEFITKELEIPKEKLYVTIYLEDDEAYEIWCKKTDVDPSRIFRLGKDDNFWEIGVGPCGPCTEIHFDRGEGKVNTVEEFIAAADEDRIVEFWNLVFTQFDKDEEGNYNKLANPNIDTGMGLERIATIMQGVDNIFEIDTIKAILNKVCELTKTKYKEDKTKDISIRIITDHVKSVAMLIGDGVLPSNEGRGYVLRRLLRRAARHGRLLGIEGLFLKDLVDTVIESYGEAYPILVEKKDYIKKIIALEEERFNETIDKGMDILKDYLKDVSSDKVLAGDKAFKLYDTYGFPIELTMEIAEEKGISVDLVEFNKEMERQRTAARDARGESNYMGADDKAINKLDSALVTEFVGYESLEVESDIIAITNDEDIKEEIKEGEKGYILTSKTPFYAEMGGQIGDTGIITSENAKAEVYDTKKNISGKTVHYVKIIKGNFKLNDKVKLTVNENKRESIGKNHTATHMLHSALKEILGDHVNQSGSYVDSERLRFDFTHFQALTNNEIESVEKLVNKKIMETKEVGTDLMNVKEARESGAMALFDEKYGDEVRVVSVGDFSKELCGGTHIKNSGQIGLFKIVSESGVAAGVRRIEAVTGFNAINYIEEKQEVLKNACTSLKCNEKDIVKKIISINEEIKEKEKEIANLKGKLASGSEDEIINSAKEIKDVKVACYSIKDIDGNSLRDLADKVRNKIGKGVVILASDVDGKVNLVAMATKDAVQSGIHCGKIIKEVAMITGGGGGGRPDMAQAGGKNPEKIQEALNKAYEIVENSLK